MDILAVVMGLLLGLLLTNFLSDIRIVKRNKITNNAKDGDNSKVQKIDSDSKFHEFFNPFREVDFPDTMKQTVILYDQDFSKGISRVIGDGGSCEMDNLENINFNDEASYFCVRGQWIFYENADFNKQLAAAQLSSGEAKNCQPLDDYFKNRISSVRCVGNPRNYTEPTLTLYERLCFRGREEKFFGKSAYGRYDVDLLQRKHQSIIITGGEPWTVKTSNNDSYCLEPNKDKMFNAVDLETIESDGETREIGYGSIVQVFLGC